MNYFIKSTRSCSGEVRKMPGSLEWCIKTAKMLDDLENIIEGYYTHEVIGVDSSGNETIHYSTTLGVVPEFEAGMFHQQFMEGR